MLAAVSDESVNSASIWVIEKSSFISNNVGIGGLGRPSHLLTHLLTYSLTH